MSAAAHKTRDLVLISLFAALIAVCAWIAIPTTVPFTMQTFGVFFAFGVLGCRRGTLAVLVYLLLGAVGLPVFSGGNAGLGAIFGTTGGYMVSWLLMGPILWAAERAFGKKTWASVLGMIAGLAVCYALGTVWFMAVYARQTGPVGLWTALWWCVIPFILPDLFKIGLAAVLCRRLSGFVR